MTAGRVRGQAGSALVELTWLSLLLLMPLLYIVLAVSAVQRSSFAVSAAARAAGRAYVLAPTQADGMVRARAAAVVALHDQGVDIGRADLRVSCTPSPGDCLSPGSVVHVVVAYPVPLPLIPSALGRDTPSIRVEAQHAAPYGTFREDRP